MVTPLAGHRHKNTAMATVIKQQFSAAHSSQFVGKPFMNKLIM